MGHQCFEITNMNPKKIAVTWCVALRSSAHTHWFELENEQKFATEDGLQRRRNEEGMQMVIHKSRGYT